jgi:IS30 family transposase
MGVRWSRMSWSDRNELWTRWRRGESLRQIAHGLRRSSSVIHTVVVAEGGIAPRPRCRSRLALTPADREDISRQLACGQSLRAISQMLGRAPSTLSREVARNGGRSAYRAAVADRQAWHRAHRPQRCRLSTHPALRRMSRGSSPSSGRPSRSRAGFDAPFRVMLTCRCPRKPSTAASSCKVAAS